MDEVTGPRDHDSEGENLSWLLRGDWFDPEAEAALIAADERLQAEIDATEAAGPYPFDDGWLQAPQFEPAPLEPGPGTVGPGAVGPDTDGPDTDGPERVRSVAERAVDALIGRTVSTSAAAAAAIAAHLAAIDDTLTLAGRNPEVFLGPNWRTVKDAADFARRSAVCELATALAVSESTLQNQAYQAGVLRRQLPLTWAALRAGRISYPKAAIIADIASALAGRISAASMTDLDQTLLAAADRLTPAKLRQKAKTVREKLHPQSAVDRHAAAMRERRVWVSAEADGMATFAGFLPAEVAYGAYARVDAAARNLAGLPGENRTLDQLRADAAGDILTAAGTPDQVRTIVNLTVPVLTLLTHDQQAPTDATSAAPKANHPSPAPLLNLTPAGTTPAADPAILEGYGPIDPDTARRLTGTATTLYRVLTDPITGATITVDRATYRPSKKLKRLVKARFATCSFPGCNRAAERCDLDHTEPFRNSNSGGNTSAANLAPLCRHHHGVKHKTGWTMKRTPTASVQWVSPRGATHDTDPPPF